VDQWTRQQCGDHHVDKVAKKNNLAFCDSRISWSAQHLEDLIKAHHHWHWVTADGHLSLEPLRQTLRRQSHLSYMNQRDDYRAQRKSPPKWQGSNIEMIEHVWHPNKLSHSNRASTHRIVYDKGWLGGNRAKSLSPDGDDDTWGACGLCVEPRPLDSLLPV